MNDAFYAGIDVERKAITAAAFKPSYTPAAAHISYSDSLSTSNLHQLIYLKESV